MTKLPVVYEIQILNDDTEADYIGVSKTITSTGSIYRIAGPLAEALHAFERKLTARAEKAERERPDVSIAIAYESGHAAGLEEAANVADAFSERHRMVISKLHEAKHREAASLASYAARSIDDVSASIRALRTSHDQR